MTTRAEEHVKVIIEVNDQKFGISGEGLWARPLGGDLYEIDNVPWHTCDVNCGDVVRAVPQKEDEWPTMIEIVRRSGHRTLQVLFEHVSDDTRDEILGRVVSWKASWEGADNQLFAIDVEPGGDYVAIRDYLRAQASKGTLWLRTATSS